MRCVDGGNDATIALADSVLYKSSLCLVCNYFIFFCFVFYSTNRIHSSYFPHKQTLARISWNVEISIFVCIFLPKFVTIQMQWTTLDAVAWVSNNMSFWFPFLVKPFGNDRFSFSDVDRLFIRISHTDGYQKSNIIKYSVKKIVLRTSCRCIEHCSTCSISMHTT